MKVLNSFQSLRVASNIYVFESDLKTALLAVEGKLSVFSFSDFQCLGRVKLQGNNHQNWVLSGLGQELLTTFAKIVLSFSQPLAATRGTPYIRDARQYYSQGFRHRNMFQIVECACLVILLEQCLFF